MILRNGLLILFFALFILLFSHSPSGADTTVGGRIAVDTTWTLANSPYLVTSTVQVYGTAATPATLTIEPGVVVKFNTSMSLQIGDSTNQGSLIARGTAANHITFTRSGTSGTWLGIIFNDKTVDSTAVIEYADFQYSGSLTMNSASPTIRNSTLSIATGNGITLNSANPVLDTITITNNGGYGISLNSSSPTITGGSLTNTNATSAGHGIGGSGSPAISNYSISVVNRAGNYGVYLSSPMATPALSITNSTIANGLWIGSTGAPTVIGNFTGNTFTNCDTSPVHIGANIVGQILNNNTFTGMTSAGKIEVIGEQVKQDSAWKKWPAPYVVVLSSISVQKDTTTASTLTIDPGVVIKFNNNLQIYVGSSGNKGVLIARGTADNKITFSTNQTTPTAGYWYGITLAGAASSASVLDNVIIEYAGAGGSSSNANLTINSSTPTITNSIFRNSAQSGIYLYNANGSPAISNSEITANKWGVYSVGSNPGISNTKIIGNTTAGITNTSTIMNVDARYTWWGNYSGPRHASNPSGTGDVISDRVLYNPWLSQAPGSSFIINDAKAMPTSLNPDGDYVTFTGTITAVSDWTITIADSNNATVRTFTGHGTAISQKWYGENDQYVKVIDGTYNYKMQAVNSATGELTIAPQGMITVSRQLPIAIMDSVNDNQMFTGGAMINIIGTAMDSTDFKNYTLDYGAGDNPASWTTIKTSTIPITSSLLHAWDTSTLTGASYTLRLTVTDNAGNAAVETARVRFLWIQNAAITESFLSPNADGTKDATTISATFTQQSNWTLTIKNASNTTVRIYTGVGTSMTQIWDGKDTAGTVVSDGSYTYQIDATSTETSVQATPKTGSIIVDATPPTALITAPASDAVLQITVTITGTATDANFDAYKAEYGPASGAGPWTLINSGASPVSSATLATWVTNDQTNTVLLQNGSYIIRLTTTDKAGNSSMVTVPVSAGNLILSNIGISSQSINTNASETTTLFFTINAPGTVTFKVIPEKQGPTGPPVYQTSQTCVAAGAYSFTWNGTGNTGTVVPDEAYLLIIEASDGTTSDTYSPGQPTGTGTVTCAQEATFSPGKNDPLTISYAPAQTGRVDIRIAWGTQNFKIIDAAPFAAGSYTYDWNGRDPAGNLLDDGATAYCSLALLRENAVVTTGDTIKVTTLKTDPYELSLSYGQFTRITYTLSRDANVTVKLISPAGAAITLVDNEYTSGGAAHELQWTGLDSSDATGKKFLVTTEGDYTVQVQAVNPVTGASAIAKGALKLRQ